jgi:hypothetical protein
MIRDLKTICKRLTNTPVRRGVSVFKWLDGANLNLEH